jgi:glycosyltransferase involved in cell wall biosynthesis
MSTELDRLVSVVITVYNGALYLAEAIESVLGQSYSPVQLIVVDDGSTDGSAEIAQSYGSALRFARQENAGPGAARNHAIELATGSYYAFLDADDRFLPGKLERQMQILDAQPEIDMVFGHITEFVSPEIDDRARALLREPVHDEPWRMTNLMLVRRDAYHRVGPYSDTLRVGIGVDWYARAVDSGLKEAVPSFLVLERRLHTSNNGIQHRDARHQYLHVLKQSLDRKRALTDTSTRPPGEG